MASTKEQKQKIVENLKEKIAKQKAVIFVDLKGLRVKDLFELRKRLRTIDSQLSVAKKTLIKLAFKETGVEVEPKKMEGEIALVFGFKDELSSAKITYQFSQNPPAGGKNLKILGGFIESQKEEFLAAEQIIELAQLPTREELLAGLARSAAAPISNFVNALQGNIRNLVYIFSQIKPSA